MFNGNHNSSAMEGNKTETLVNNSPSSDNSYELITEELVRDGLQNDKGKNAELLSWEVKDFTNKGDGYTSFVTSITVNYKEGEHQSVVSYVVKLNPQATSKSPDRYDESDISKRKSDVIGAMSKHLEELGLTPIRTPKLFASTMEKGREAFVAENLRTQGFQLHNKRIGLDFNHSLLNLEDSMQVLCSLKNLLLPNTYAETFEYFEEHWFDANCKYYTHVFDKTIISQVLGAIKYLNTIPKYEKCAKWLNENKQNLSQYFLEGFKSNKPLEVLIHGDCWTNNLLFKYNSKNKPVDLRLVDLQVSRLASPGSDINYFVYTSLTGDTRSKYFHDLLDAYYQSFSKVLILSRRKIPFTFKIELEDDVREQKSLD
ncbi:hypothetical protein Avbf_04791 [Armadillidium vulgare]|nr:hypothetical protein Avbf_04791 [Armadillidium vulgare]